MADEKVPITGYSMKRPPYEDGSFPVLLLDGVDQWYRRDLDESTLEVRRRALIKQLHHFGRLPNVIAVVAGSSSCLREQVFAQGRWKGYPALNPTVFVVAELCPFRTIEALEQYITQTSLKLPAGMTPTELFSLSGGVCGTIERVLVGDLSISDVQKCFMEDHNFALLIFRMLEQETVTTESISSSKVLGIPLCEAIYVLQRLGNSTDVCENLVSAWRDAGLFWLSPSYRLELLYPYHERIYYDLLLENSELRDMLSIRLQAHGVGVCMEQHVLQRLCHNGGLANLFKCQRKTVSISMSVGKLYVSDGSPFIPQNCLNVVCQMAAEVGIQDFVLHRDEMDEHVIYVDAWQCNTVLKVGTIVTAGVNVLEDMIKHRSISPATDNKNLSHTLARASWGFCALTALLHKHSSSPEAVFVPRKLYMCTVGTLDKAAIDLSNKPAELSPELVTAFNGSKRAATLGITCPATLAGHSFLVEVMEGLAWTAMLISDCLTSVPALQAAEREARSSVGRLVD